MKNVNTTPPPRFCDMGDEELTAAIEKLEYDVAVITEQMTVDLQEGSPRGDTWRRKAGVAKGFSSAHLKLARTEMHRRATCKNVDNKARIEVEKALIYDRAQLKRLEIAHAHALRQLSQAEGSAAWEKHNARRARCFLIAASRMLARDQLDEIWQRAEAMFPEMPKPPGFDAMQKMAA